VWENRSQAVVVIVVGNGDQTAAVEQLRSELEECGWFDECIEHSA